MLDTKSQAQNIDLDNYLTYSQNTDDDKEDKDDKDDDDDDDDNEDDDDCEGDGVWKLKGNKLKCPEQYFGTKSYDDLIFKTNALERFRITKDGDFIFAPNLSLTFPNGASFDSVGTHKLFTEYLQVGGLNGTGTALLKVTSNGTVVRFPLTNNANHYLKGDGTFGLGAFSVNGNTVYSNNTGFVGIGTSNPIEKLHVAGNIKFDGNLMNSIIHSDKTTGEVTIDGKLIADEAHVKGLLKVGTGTLLLQGNLQPGSDNTISTDGGNLRISPANGFNTIFGGSNTKVGIGTSSPSGLLTVSSKSPLVPSLSVIQNCSVFGPPGSPFCDGTHNVFEVKKMNPSSIPLFVVKDTGRVGVNTDDPKDKFHIFKGSFRMDGLFPSMDSDPANPGDIETVGLRMGIRQDIVNGRNHFGWLQTYNAPLAINPEGNTIYFGTKNALVSDAGTTVKIVSASPNDFAFVVDGDESDFFPIHGGMKGNGSFFCSEIRVPGPATGINFFVSSGGEVKCRKVQVTAGPIPDYVFEKDYKLMSLAELKAYIEQHKHLPEIPSANEIKEADNSYDMGKMVEQLLLKVEELTLYTIEQQKLIEELQRK